MVVDDGAISWSTDLLLEAPKLQLCGGTDGSNVLVDRQVLFRAGEVNQIFEGLFMTCGAYNFTFSSFLWTLPQRWRSWLNCFLYDSSNESSGWRISHNFSKASRIAHGGTYVLKIY